MHFRSVVNFFRVPLTPDPVERRLSGRVGGTLWMCGAGVMAAMRLLPGGGHIALVPALLLVLGALGWGICSLWVIDWVGGRPWLTHLTAFGGVGAVAYAVSLTGGADSRCWPYFMWLALYGCFFFRRPVAVAYIAACLLAQLLPLTYDFRTVVHSGGFFPDLLMSVSGYGTIGLAIIAGKELLAKLRGQAEREANTDPLTGMANHRGMDHALRRQLARSDAQLAVAVVDVDDFKRFHDGGEHEFADAALRALADTLRLVAEPGDELARTGGDEFTWLMPGASAAAALGRVEAARALLATLRRPFALTFSAGISHSSQERDPAGLVRLAEGALYWSKARGRNQTRVFDPCVDEARSAQERADMLERSQALLGLRALARAIDAKDPATHAHSERVAAMVEQLALSAGWEESRAGLLREAALVHDVGKIGVDDAVLRKPGLLTAAERAHINAHAEISARIVDGVLCEEQVDWIRAHHERADGGGYPLGLVAADIPEGAALLAIADAFDVMTSGRHYCARREPAEALEECRAQAGRQFTDDAVATIVRWLEPAELAVDGDPLGV